MINHDGDIILDNPRFGTILSCPEQHQRGVLPYIGGERQEPTSQNSRSLAQSERAIESESEQEREREKFIDNQ